MVYLLDFFQGFHPHSHIITQLVVEILRLQIPQRLVFEPDLNTKQREVRERIVPNKR